MYMFSSAGGCPTQFSRWEIEETSETSEKVKGLNNHNQWYGTTVLPGNHSNKWWNLHACNNPKREGSKVHYRNERVCHGRCTTVCTEQEDESIFYRDVGSCRWSHLSNTESSHSIRSSRDPLTETQTSSKGLKISQEDSTVLRTYRKKSNSTILRRYHKRTRFNTFEMQHI